MAAVFERIAHEHCRHSEEAKERKSIHAAMLSNGNVVERMLSEKLSHTPVMLAVQSTPFPSFTQPRPSHLSGRSFSSSLAIRPYLKPDRAAKLRLRKAGDAAAGLHKHLSRREWGS